MNIVQVKMEDLKMAEYNPRQLTKAQKLAIVESIRRFGLVEPIVVNSAKGRQNIIIGGHQRFRVCQEMGFKDMPVVYVKIPDLKKEQELNIRLNKNLGEWDYDLLANFDEELLNIAGFENKELKQIFNLELSEEKKYCPNCGVEIIN